MLREMQHLAETDEVAGTSPPATAATHPHEHMAQHAYLNAVLTRPEFTPTVTLSRAFNWHASKSRCMSESRRCMAPELHRKYCDGVIPIIRRVEVD
jgi:hypothetical protein